MITDVFSLSRISADELRWSEEPRARFPHVPAHDVGPQELTRLAGLLGVGTADDLVGGFSLLAGESQQSPWVVSIPAALLEGVAALDEGEIEPLANRWEHPDELASATPPAARADYLRRLVRFLREHEGPFALYIHTETGDR